MSGRKYGTQYGTVVEVPKVSVAVAGPKTGDKLPEFVVAFFEQMERNKEKHGGFSNPQAFFMWTDENGDTRYSSYNLIEGDDG